MTEHRTLFLALNLVLGFLIAACSGGGGGGAGGGGDGGATPVVVQAQGTVDTNGGTVEVSAAASPIRGAKVIVPAGALDSGVTAAISIGYQEVLPGSLTTSDPAAVSASKVIVLTKDNPADFKEPVDVVIPYTDANMQADDIPGVFCWDETYQEYASVAVKSLDKTNKTITFSTVHFTNYVALAINGLAANLGVIGSVDTGFKPDQDGFFHPNTTFYDVGLGNCVGMSNYASWYYKAMKKKDGTGLYLKYRQGDPQNYKDDTTARELITRSAVASSQSWASIAGLTGLASSGLTGFNLITAMKIDKAPQVMSFNYGSPLALTRHAVLAYRYDASENRFYVYDNNFPGEVVTVEWNLVDGFFNYSKEQIYKDRFGGSLFAFAFVPRSTFLTGSYFEDIYQGAEQGWTGDNFNSVSITSPALDGNNAANVTEAIGGTFAISGKVSGGTRPAAYLKYKAFKLASGGGGSLAVEGTLALGSTGDFTFDRHYDAGVYWIVLLATDNVSDAYLFRPHPYAGLKQITLTVTEAKLPILLGSVDLPAAALGVTVVGNLAYVRDNETGLRIVDVTNPAAPALLGAANISYYSNGNGIFVAGSYAYVGSGAFYIVDVSNALSPVKVSSQGFNAASGDLVVAGNFAYIAAGKLNYESTGLFAIADITEPTKQKDRWVGGLQIPGGNIKAIALSGAYAFLVDVGNFKMYVVDVSNPAAPVTKAEVPLPSWPTSGNSGIFLDGNRAFVAEPAGYAIIDITVPTAPTVLFQTTTSSYLHDVSVVGNLAYFLASERLIVMDVTDPVKTAYIGSVDLPAYGSAIFISGNLAYVAQTTTDNKGKLVVYTLGK